jgi:hypothetical protein
MTGMILSHTRHSFYSIEGVSSGFTMQRSFVYYLLSDRPTRRITGRELVPSVANGIFYVMHTADG